MSALLSSCLLMAWFGFAGPEQSGGLRIEGALITLIDQAEVPALEAGVLSQLSVREGQTVQEGEILVQIDDVEAKLEQRRAQVDLEMAVKQGGNDVKVRFARKSHEVAQAESRRAIESVEKYKKSVSQSELDQLALSAERAALEIEQAQHDQEMFRLTSELRRSDLLLATRQVERRRIVAPIAGMVVQVQRHKGEWVQPGDTVLRIVRLDVLRAEGFVQARDLKADLTGCRATLLLESPGKPPQEYAAQVSFVSPEVNPVSGQVRLWAEVQNRDLRLRPGLQATLRIDGPAAP